MVDEGDGRPLRTLLLVGMLVAPLPIWLLFLRRCYRRSLRRAALAYTLTMLAVGLLGRL